LHKFTKLFSCSHTGGVSVILDSGCMVLCPIGQRQRQRKRKNDWAEELKFDPVLCKCGIGAKYGLVPSEFGVGYFCGHMVDYDEVGIYFLFAPAVMLHPYYIYTNK
jgi:hypothetical protein